ncbi:hypothetical protein D3C85_1884940 [compost metagenome]
MVSAIAALRMAARSLWNPPSSITTLPCIPRKLLGLELSALILKPLAKLMT